jgi:hypothetical protein
LSFRHTQEAQRCRRAQYSGQATALTLKGSRYFAWFGLLGKTDQADHHDGLSPLSRWLKKPALVSQSCSISLPEFRGRLLAVFLFV